MKLVTMDSVKSKVDDFLELHEQVAELNKVLEKKKKALRKEMDTRQVTELEGSSGLVRLSPTKKSNSTAIYTDYELNEVMAILKGSDLRKVTEIRVNGKKLTELFKSLPVDTVAQLKDSKVSRGSGTRFTAVHNKKK